MILGEFIRDLNAAAGVKLLIDLFEQAATGLGYERFALVHLHVPGAGEGIDVTVPPTVALNYPQDWVDHYVSRGYFAIDPVVRHARVTATPYEWDSLRMQDSEERLVLIEACDAGLRHGICMPIHEPWGRVFLIVVATSSNSKQPTSVRPLLHAMAVLFHARYSVLAGSQDSPQSIRLTLREQECLLWSARGKSSWGISRLISVSEHTVNFHLKNAMGKLGTSSRVAAAVKAMSLGLISPP